jgi:dihydroorotase
MAEVGMPLLVHGEVTDSHVDIFDREKVFISTVLAPLISRHPTLKVVMEHITTADAVEYVLSQPATVAATITAHHLLYNRNDLFKGGICPHMFCLPILKREQHRQALVAAATSGNPKFFLGTDSAPHAVTAKESSCGCAGIFTGHAAIELYAEAFDAAGCLDRLEAFSSQFGAAFYGLKSPTSATATGGGTAACDTTRGPRGACKITLVREDWQVPGSYKFGSAEVRPLRAGEAVKWRVVEM